MSAENVSSLQDVDMQIDQFSSACVFSWAVTSVFVSKYSAQNLHLIFL